MYDDGKNVNDIFDANDPFDDLDIGLDQDASIHPLTIRGGEEDIYPDGFGEVDGMNEVEMHLAVMEDKNKNGGVLDSKIKEEYMLKFRKEVDFHHKVAYRFEKAYRLGKKHSQKKT